MGLGNPLYWVNKQFQIKFYGSKTSQIHCLFFSYHFIIFFVSGFIITFVYIKALPLPVSFRTAVLSQLFPHYYYVLLLAYSFYVTSYGFLALS